MTWKDFKIGDEVEYKYRLDLKSKWIKGTITKSTPARGNHNSFSR